MRPTRWLAFAALGPALAPPVHCQEPAPAPTARGFRADGAEENTVEREDYRELHLFGGFRFQAPGLHLDVRGTNALVLSDREGTRALAERASAEGLPRRGIAPPAPRRRLSPEQVRARLDSTLRAIGRVDGLPRTPAADQAIDVLRYLYFEGNVVVVRDGVEVLRCERLWISPLEDRIVVEQAELRYLTPGGNLSKMLVVRGPRLTKQGPRWTGRDLTITTCTAAEPHAALAAGEAEIIEREGEFEVIVRGQTLQLGGTNVLPLPDAHIFTGSQSEFPIKRASAGYSQKEGVRSELVLGLPWNATGGELHRWLTGRSEKEFRGEWQLGVGWIETRGVPLSGGLSYGAAGLYEGRTEGFWLDDRGEDLREIQSNYDGSPITTESRGLVRTENRVHFGPNTHVDLQAFAATDPAVYSEFFGGEYRTAELPETSGYLHHADGNRLFTIGTRFNLDDFSYRDDRALAEKFTEELPVVTYHWLAQPIGETPWETPIVLDMSTELGQRRSDYDDRAGTRVADRTFRADQNMEVSAPFHVGDVYVRPYFAGRGTFYDNAVDGSSEGRVALDAGVQLGTRMSRTWSWLENGEARGVRHVMAPRVTFANRFFVDDDPSEFYTFDELDTLSEQQLVRAEFRNLVQRMEPIGGKPQPRDFLFLDLAQDFWPDAARDNGGETLGLFYYDLLVRPRAYWIPFETFTYAIYGDHDWDDGMRTFDTELQFGPLAGLTWTADYRADSNIDGAVGLSARTRLLDRWDLFAGSQRDLESDLWLDWTFGLRRNDHDWSIELSASYDPYSDETSIRLEFLPRFGGMSRRGTQRFGSELQYGSFATSY